MIETSQNNKRIAKNTMLLYIRMIVMMVISFFTMRIILQSLGEVNYGIYDVVGGLVAMFTLISSSLSSSVSRFFTFALGKGNIQELKKTFSVSVNIHILLAVIVIIFIEVIGVWFLNNKMEIPSERLYAANWVLQCSAVAFAINLISVPYNAAIIAHEKMSAFAYMTLYDATIRLAIAHAVKYYTGDKLIFYTLLCLFPPTTSLLMYWRYCKKNFESCTYTFMWDSKLFKEIFSFAGWSFIGSIAGAMKNQGVNLVLNVFYGPVVNAARGIAMQVNGIVTHFITNFTMALNPQIIKDYAAGDLTRMHKLIFIGTRFSYYLFMTLSIPIFLEIDTILSLWLGDVPNHTIIFTRLVLILSLAEIISQTLITAQAATGKIKTYQIVVGGILLLNLPLSYIALSIGLPPESTIIIAIIISQICFVVRLYFLRSMASLPVMSFIKNVYFNVIIVTLFSVSIPILCHMNIENDYIRFVTVGAISLLTSAGGIYFIGCKKRERELAINIISKVKNKVFKR